MVENRDKYQLVVRNFNLATDYVMIESWWNAHGDAPLPPEYLSTTGLIVEAEGSPICAGFLYKTDSKICMLQFPISNPEADKDIRDLSMCRLIKSAKAWAELNKFGLIYASGSIPKYVSRLESEGFIKIGSPQFHLFYKG